MGTGGGDCDPEGDPQSRPKRGERERKREGGRKMKMLAWAARASTLTFPINEPPGVLPMCII